MQYKTSLYSHKRQNNSLANIRTSQTSNKEKQRNKENKEKQLRLIYYQIYLYIFIDNKNDDISHINNVV